MNVIVPAPPRSRATLLSIVDALKVETNPRYQRRDVTGDGIPETFCNLFASDVCHQLGALLPYILVNLQFAWLQTFSAQDEGWEDCSAARAGVNAEVGRPTIAIWANPGGHGHVAVVVPSLVAPGLHIAQAGRTNFSNGPLERGFGPYLPRFFTHA